MLRKTAHPWPRGHSLVRLKPGPGWDSQVGWAGQPGMLSALQHQGVVRTPITQGVGELAMPAQVHANPVEPWPTGRTPDLEGADKAGEGLRAAEQGTARWTGAVGRGFEGDPGTRPRPCGLTRASGGHPVARQWDTHTQQHRPRATPGNSTATRAHMEKEM